MANPFLRKFTAEEHAANLEAALIAKRAKSELIKTVETNSLANFRKILILAAEKNATAKNIKVKRILKHIPGIGEATAVKILHETEINEHRTVTGLSAGQRERLDAAITAFLSKPKKGIHEESPTSEQEAS